MEISGKTIRLFDEDSHGIQFKAKVMSSEKYGDKYDIVLDRTMFFPEGGGQPSDTGKIEDNQISYVFEKNGIIHHICDHPVIPGNEIAGEIDYALRFRRMQNHTGEHIISGIVNKHFGFNNVGFHMGSDGVTMDYDGVLEREELLMIEKKANEAVVKNIPVSACYPSSEELSSLEYRCKLELKDNIRIVNIPGYDTCACCAPHVKNTGEIGIIKILDYIHYKGGVRVWMLAGFDAVDDYTKKYSLISSSARFLSVKQNELEDAVIRMKNENSRLKRNLSEVKKELLFLKVNALEKSDGNICFFSEDLDPNDIRFAANILKDKCIIAAVFSKDKSGMKYAAVSDKLDITKFSQEINTVLSGKGGGRDGMIFGNVTASENEIKKYFENRNFME